MANVVAQSWIDPVTKAWASLLIVALIGALLTRGALLATTTDPRRLTIREWLRTRRIAWSEIQEICAEFNPGSAMSTLAPGEVAVVYDRHGHRTILPHIDDRNLAAMGSSLRDEVRALRTIWYRHRGRDWAPAPRVARQIAENRTHPCSPWMTGLLAGVMSIPLVGGVLVLGLITGWAQGPPPLPLLTTPELVLVVPPIVAVLVALITKGRRR